MVEGGSTPLWLKKKILKNGISHHWISETRAHTTKPNQTRLHSFYLNLDIVSVKVKPTDLRLNDDYIFYYNNLAKLIITGVIPFAALCVFNFKVSVY